MLCSLLAYMFFFAANIPTAAPPPVASTLRSLVTNTNDSDPGSLRAAIKYANAHPGTTIVFQIPTSDRGCSNGACTIRLQSARPVIKAKRTVIDGRTTSKKRRTARRHTIIIIISGASAGKASGLVIHAAQCVVHGLVIISGGAKNNTIGTKSLPQ